MRYGQGRRASRLTYFFLAHLYHSVSITSFFTNSLVYCTAYCFSGLAHRNSGLSLPELPLTSLKQPLQREWQNWKEVTTMDVGMGSDIVLKLNYCFVVQRNCICCTLYIFSLDYTIQYVVSGFRWLGGKN